MMYAGDELYGDDITSGPFGDDVDEDVSFRAFCEQRDPECLWSGDSCATEDLADGQLADHTERKHPGQPVRGSIDET
jgi:hypothetical protein